MASDPPNSAEPTERPQALGGDLGRQEDAKRKKSPLRNPLVIVGAILLVAVIVIASVLWWLHARNFETTDDAYIDAHIVRVAPQVSGQVVQIFVNDNSRVRPGDPLAQIDPADPRARVDQLQAQEAQARAQLAQAEQQIRVNQASYEQASASAMGAGAEAVSAARDYDRYISLKRTLPIAVAQQQLDQAQAAAQNTAAQKLAAEKQAKGAAAQVDAARAQIAAAQAQIANAVAQREDASITLGRTLLTSPIAGHVTQSSLALGTYLQPGQQVMAIVPIDVWVTANFKETQLAHMRVGQPVDIRIDAYPNVKFHGHVDSIQHGAGQAFGILPPENATGNFVKVVQRVPVKIVIDRPDPRDYPLGPGMSVTPRVEVR
jgi:membrane fusion protein (multidrug efflux system)